jgi:hypothetical protein
MPMPHPMTMLLRPGLLSLPERMRHLPVDNRGYPIAETRRSKNASPS